MMIDLDARSDRLRVLHSLSAPNGTTRYVDQMTDGAPPDVEVLYFSWARALRGDYDILHLHWPEFLLRARSRRKRALKRLAMRATLRVTQLRGIPIVRTVHNVRPHESAGGSEQRLLDRIDRRTALFIRLNPTTELEGWMASETILHGHYRDRFARHPKPPREAGLILYFGIIRPYKGVEHLITTYTADPPPGSRLRIVGSPSPELRPRIESLVDADPAVTCELTFVDDDQLVAEVSAATLVVLPYAEMHNSGAALVALSLDRPVLVPRTPSNEALAAEVGEEWVNLYDGPLNSETLAAAIRRASALEDGIRPRLDGRDWDEVGRRHRDAYLSALAGDSREEPAHA